MPQFDDDHDQPDPATEYQGVPNDGRVSDANEVPPSQRKDDGESGDDQAPGDEDDKASFPATDPPASS